MDSARLFSMAIESLIPLLSAYRYWLVFPLACVEGPAVAAVAGFMVSLGVLQALPVYLLLLLGDLVPDTVFYVLGRTGHQSAFIRRFSEKRLAVIEHFWLEHTFKSMVVAKWALGLSGPLLVSAGLARLPFWRFLGAALPISLFQYAAFLAAGYFFGLSFQTFRGTFLAAELVVVLGIVLFIAATMYFSRAAKRVLPPEAAPRDS